MLLAYRGLCHLYRVKDRDSYKLFMSVVDFHRMYKATSVSYSMKIKTWT